LGYFWHLAVFADQYHRLEIYREDVIIPMGLASMMMQAGIYAWAYPKLFGVKGEGWGRNALRFGLVFGALAWSFTILPVAAKFQMTSVRDFIMLETGFTVLQYAVVSPLIALAYRGWD